MRPDGTPHLYETPMVPNLLPFSATVTTGAGPIPTSAAGPVAEAGFAAMLGSATPPTPGAAANPIAVSVPVMPQGKAPLFGFNTDLTVAPVDVALPDQAEIADPIAAAVVPEQTLVVPLALPEAVAPTPSPAAGSTADAAPTAPAAIAKTNNPVTTLTPEGGSVTVVDGPRKTAILDPAPVAETPIEGQATPTPIAKPTPPVAGTGGTVTTVDGPDKTVLPPTPTGSDAPVAPTRKPADPAPVPGPQGGTMTIVEPVRKAAAPTPVEPKAIPTPEDGSVTVIDGPRKQIVTPNPEAPIETAPVGIEPAAVESMATKADAATPVLVDDAAALTDAPTEPNTAQLQTPVMAPVSAAPVTPVTVEDVAAPTPAQTPLKVETPATSAAPVALRVVEPAAAEIAGDAPADHGAFDTLFAAKSDADTDTLRTTSDAGGDAMNRDGNRQSTPQPAAPTPAAAQAATTALPAFDPLAAAAPQGATHTGDPAAAEPRARAAAIGEDVAVAIVRHADGGSGDVLVIRLDPAELGKIEVRLRMDEARQLSAEVTADQPATLDLLRRDSDNLTRALNDAGFRADDQSLRFDSRGFGQSDQQAQQGRRIASRAYLNDGDPANAQSTPTPVQVRSSGRVDLVA